MPETLAHLHEPVLQHARLESPLLQAAMTIADALSVIRREGVGERIIYFYVTDEARRLVGVLPTRRLLISPTEKKVGDIMISRVVAIPQHATLLDACEMFVLHKFLAFPVVDAERHVVGIIDVSVFTEEMLDLGEPEQTDDLFESLGFRISQVSHASSVKAFQYRFPWLLATISSGTVAAILAGVFEATLARVLLVAFFLTLVLALAESVSVQSMTLTLQALRTSKPTLRWFKHTVRKEFLTAVLLGAACGSVVFIIVWAWRGAPIAAAVIGASVAGSLLIACLSGVCIPSLLHALRLDPKIAAGPITLATTDLLTLLLYFSLASWLL